MTPREEMYLALALADLELTREQYAIIKAKPFREWPKDMQDLLRPYGAAAITTGPDPTEP